MTAGEVAKLIERTLADLPERISGNEANPIVAEKLRSVVDKNRKSVIEALKSYLAFRVTHEQRKPEDAVPEARIWMALDVIEELSLSELQSEIEALISDVQNGKVLLPVHEASIARYLQRIRGIN